MTPKVHKEIHIFAHRVLEDLLLDFVSQTGRRFSETSIVDLIIWSRQQTEIPDETTAQVYDHERAQNAPLSEGFLAQSQDGRYDELIGDWFLAEGSDPGSQPS